MGCAPSKGKAQPKLFGLDLTTSRSRSRNQQDNELDVSKHSKGEPALEPPPRVDSQSVLSQNLTKVVMQIRGADSRLLKECTVDRTHRLITFDELEKPMKELGSGEFCVALLSKLDGKDVVV